MDGCRAGNKNIEGYAATRPGSAPTRIGLVPVYAIELSGLDVARKWKYLLLMCVSDDKDLATAKDGFILSLRRAPDAMCSDSAGVNQKAREIVALRFPGTVLLPCFAHFVALDCPDLLKTELVAEVVPEMIRTVTFFNASTNKCPLRVQEGMVK